MLQHLQLRLVEEDRLPVVLIKSEYHYPQQQDEELHGHFDQSIQQQSDPALG